MTTNTHRSIAVLLLPQPVPLFCKAGHSIVTQMTGNVFFAGAAPQIAHAATLLTALDAAELATKTRAPGSVATRNAAKRAAKAGLQILRGIAQEAADASPEQADAIITSAGMSVRKAPIRTGVSFDVKPGPVTGSAKAVAKAAATRASYDWQWSADGGKTWAPAPSSLQAKTTITGLPVGVAVMFRYRAVTKVGPGDWSQVVMLLVK
jgi:hypothetical protein